MLITDLCEDVILHIFRFLPLLDVSAMNEAFPEHIDDAIATFYRLNARKFRTCTIQVSNERPDLVNRYKFILEHIHDHIEKLSIEYLVAFFRPFPEFNRMMESFVFPQLKTLVYSQTFPQKLPRLRCPNGLLELRFHQFLWGQHPHQIVKHHKAHLQALYLIDVVHLFGVELVPPTLRTLAVFSGERRLHLHPLNQAITRDCYLTRFYCDFLPGGNVDLCMELFARMRRTLVECQLQEQLLNCIRWEICGVLRKLTVNCPSSFSLYRAINKLSGPIFRSVRELTFLGGQSDEMYEANKMATYLRLFGHLEKLSFVQCKFAEDMEILSIARSIEGLQVTVSDVDESTICYGYVYKP